MDILAERIKEARIARGLSQEQLALMAGYTSRASVSKIEKGHVDVPRSKVEALASALRVSPAWLLGLDNVSIDDQFIIEYKAATPDIKARLLEYWEFLNTRRTEK